MKVAVVGSREYKDLGAVESFVRVFLRPGDVLVSGGARGVDKKAEVAAQTQGNNTVIFYPDWSCGKRAGFERNKDIVAEVDVVVAFWDGQSRGTQSTIRLARQKGIPVFVICDPGAKT